MSTVSTYKDFASLYDMYVAGFSADLPLYLNFCDGNHRILELGCGTGRVLKCLAESGCNVLGVDISGDMLEIAETKLHRFLLSGNIRLNNFNFLDSCLDEKFDRVLITFYTLNYLIDDTQCELFLNNVQRSMNRNGMIIIDLFYPGPLQRPDTAGVWYKKDVEVNGKTVQLKDKRTMIGNVEERVQEYITEDKSIKIVSKRRFYSKQDILRILEKCGFDSIEVTDDYNVKEFHRVKCNEKVISNFIVKAEIK